MYLVETRGLKIEMIKQTNNVNQELCECLGFPLCRNEFFYHDKQIITDMIPDFHQSAWFLVSLVVKLMLPSRHKMIKAIIHGSANCLKKWYLKNLASQTY